MVLPQNARGTERESRTIWKMFKSLEQEIAKKGGKKREIGLSLLGTRFHKRWCKESWTPRTGVRGFVLQGEGKPKTCAGKNHREHARGKSSKLRNQ